MWKLFSSQPSTPSLSTKSWCQQPQKDPNSLGEHNLQKQNFNQEVAKLELGSTSMRSWVQVQLLVL
jgi:hypothetical protein